MVVPLRLVWRNLTAHKLRSALTFGSVVLAVFLLCILRGTTAALSSSVEKAAVNRLWVQSAVSLYVDLPLAYGQKIASVDGVEWVNRWQWFGGKYRDAGGFFAQFGVDPDTFLKSYPEVEIVDGTDEAFQHNRTGCVVGADLASRYGWKVGDHVPLLGTIFPRAGDAAWDFTIEAIYRSKSSNIDQATLYFHFDYLRESLETSAAFGPEGVGVYLVKIRDGHDPTPIMAAIDALFENGPQRVQTTTEGEFNRQFLSMLGNVPALLTMIGGAVLFAILFAVLNTMLTAARERVRDVGIMKALGFSDSSVRALLVLEALALCGGAGLVAVGLIWSMRDGLARALIAMRIPGFEVTPGVLVTGLAIALGLGLIAGLAPAWQVGRWTPVKALRMEA